MHVQQMISTHPHVKGSPNNSLIHCIEECFDCAQVCTACADACLGEEMVADLTQCIRLDLDCADLCMAAGKLASRRTGSNEAILHRALELCAEACRLCAEECDRHAGLHQHCRVCAETCRKCEEVCRTAAGSIRPGVH